MSARAQTDGSRPLTPSEREAADSSEVATAPILTKPPVLTKLVDPIYPERPDGEARAAVVVVVLTIEADGRVSEAVLAGPPIGGGFDEAALEAARQLEFEPAEFDGQPGAIRIEFTFRFEPEVPAPAPAPAPVDGRIAGRVREKTTGASIPAARVVLVGPETETYADARGKFAFEGLAPGAYVVAASSPDHRGDRIEAVLEAGNEIAIEFGLEALSRSPNEIIVRGRRVKTSLTRRTLEREVLRTVPGTFGDPGRVVQNLPGLARAPFIVGVLLVRGSGPGDSAVLINGHEVPLLYHFLGGPSILPPEMLGRIDLYPGNFTVKYGRAIGGIIDVGTQPTEPVAWTASAEVDLFDAGVFAAGPVAEQTSISASVRRSYIDGVIRGVNAVVGGDGAAVLPRYWDYQSRLDHRFEGDHRLSLLVFGSDDSLQIVGSGTGAGDGPNEDVSAAIGFHRLEAEWVAREGEAVRWTLSPVLGYDRTRFDAGEAALDADVLELGLRFDLELELDDDLELRMGLDGLGRVVGFSASIPLLVPSYRPFPGSSPGDREVTGGRPTWTCKTPITRRTPSSPPTTTGSWSRRRCPESRSCRPSACGEASDAPALARAGAADSADTAVHPHRGGLLRFRRPEEGRRSADSRRERRAAGDDGRVCARQPRERDGVHGDRRSAARSGANSRGQPRGAGSSTALHGAGLSQRRHEAMRRRADRIGDVGGRRR